MNKEFFFVERQGNPNEVVQKELEAQGWQKAGMEYTHETKLNLSNMRFEPVEMQTRLDIENRYLEQYGKHGFVEVKLIPFYKKSELKDEWIENPHCVYVFMKKRENAK
jgi:hypothetical protein